MPYKEFPGTSVGLAPRSYGRGRPYGPLIWIVWHSTEGSEGPRSAEDGNAYDARRTDGTSTHVFVDSNSVVQEVNSGDRAWAALSVANNRGYQVELCARASQTGAQWWDAASAPMLELAAQHVAWVCMKHDIPPRWLTKADVDARRKGFLTHKNVTDWLEGTHTDPGPNFPAKWMASRVAYWIKQYTHPSPTVPVNPSRRKNMLVQKSGEDEVWCVVPGVGRYHVTKDAYPSHVAVYGKQVTGPGVDPAAFGPEIPAPGTEKS
jgi:hypothetical protein